MKVLHIELGKHLYGGAKQVTFIMQGLKDDFGVDNVLLATRGSVIAQEMKQRGFQVIEIAAKGDLDIGLLWRIKKAIQQVQPDLVHVHSRRGADVWGGLAAKWAKVPAVISRRVDNPESRWVTRWKYGLYDKVITISEGIRTVLLSQGLTAENVVCVRSALVEDATSACNPIDFRARFNLASDALVIGVVAQLIERKGHSYLLTILPALLESFPQIKVLFFGKGKYRETLEQQIAQLGLKETVQFTGFCEDMPRLFGCIDLLVHPALMEGLGVSLLQASQQGVPIVASAVGGIPEAVEDGVNGLLVPAADTKALQNAIEKLLQNPELRQQMGENAKQFMRQQFSVQQMVVGNHEVYQQLLNRH
ncbi:glycosyl transferase [Thiosulfatimonas sediminis]|uniref:Glycosyl transferase n=1 Tax=Thiosulfatimonas sediminis TaxID=2675054 RepID=A0A6F8PWT9_9GAMM|nr:glycosyltransferase [Thiosulfatimonas sediminis]BBP46622.1 glycosyl transferase [Thiosulfatimonas sediminis]